MLADAEQDVMDHEFNELDLFHGTDSLNTCRGICVNNFDFRISGRNATLYGQGSYFATRAKLSHSYTKTDSQKDVRFMFRAKVLVGQYTKGNPSLTRPPNIPGKIHKLFDSCVDKEDDPSIFVVFDRSQCYPEYLIMYTDNEVSSVNPRLMETQGIKTTNNATMLPDNGCSMNKTNEIVYPETVIHQSGPLVYPESVTHKPGQIINQQQTNMQPSGPEVATNMHKPLVYPQQTGLKEQHSSTITETLKPLQYPL